MTGNSASGQAAVFAPRARQSAIKQRKFLIGGAIVVLAIAYLIYSSMAGSTVYYLTPTEVKNQAGELQGQIVRIGGTVVDRPVNYDAKTRTLRFEITDNTTTFPVVYVGIVPDAFKPGIEVVVEGKYTAAGVFEATTLLAKCPSKYVPEL